jgi:hypothetical protein
MTLTRQTWRFLAAIFLIAAYVMPSMVHAHAGHVHGAAPVAAMHADHASEVEVGQTEADHAGDPITAKAHPACCAACACCGAKMVSEGPVLSRSWQTVRLALGRPEAVPPSRAPEALPEPPRSFA